MSELAMAMGASTAMVLCTVLLHYEALNLISRLLRHLRQPSRLQILIVIIGIFAAHSVEIWLYAAAYLTIDHLQPGLDIAGRFEGAWVDYVYYSAVSYTSLGLGDLYPTGALRLVTGVEALNGLLLIGWSASFTYLAMEKAWRI